MFKYLSLLVLLALSTAYAGVNLKNGNYYITYTDIVVPGGGQKLGITRTYNSKAPELGWFGVGWGSKFETRLEVSSDGSVVIHENGSGAQTRFTPKKHINPKIAVDKIIKALEKKTALTSTAKKNLEGKLLNNAELRHHYSKKLSVVTKLAKGTKLYSNERGMQSVVVTEDGYKRKHKNGKVDYFDSEGRFVKVKEKSGYFVKIEYKGKSKQVATIKDSQNKQLFFDWYSSGRVKSIWSAGDKKAEFKYEKNDLVYAKDVAGVAYTYKYEKNHYLSEIHYTDKTKRVIKYHPKSHNVASVTERSGEKTSYKYEVNPKNKDLHRWTLVSKKGFNGKPVTNRYEYEYKLKADGARYTYRVLTIINNVKTETIYSECCSLPLKIARGKHVTTFEYNEDGLLTKKASTKGDFVNITYNKKLKKIQKVVNNDGWTKFDYDNKGNLIKAVNNNGKAVLLVYDRKGKITKMVDNNSKTKKRRILSFRYNALGKPVEIDMEKKGKINVSYDNYGQIKKVESKQGHKMALQVTQAFQNLLSIVKPAGVNLNM